jgi:hypothetical protein
VALHVQLEPGREVDDFLVDGEGAPRAFPGCGNGRIAAIRAT